MGEYKQCMVLGFGPATDGRRIRDVFTQFGQILECKIIAPHENGMSRCAVTFANEPAAIAAVQAMNGKKLDGANITVRRFRKVEADELKKVGRSGAPKNNRGAGNGVGRPKPIVNVTVTVNGKHIPTINRGGGRGGGRRGGASSSNN